MMTKELPTAGDAVGTSGNCKGAADVSKGKYTPKRHKAQAAHNTMKAWAVRYVMAGWRVLPLVPGGKAPRIRSAHPEGDPLRGVCKGECGKPGHGVHDATDDLEVIKDWWNKWPTANIGLALGNDLVALDLDPRNGGDLAHLDRLQLDPAGATTARTGGGGWHVIYHKPPSKTFMSHVPRLDGLDVLTGDRYIVAAPSIVAGNRYEWIRDPFDYPPARMPLSVAERLEERRQTPQDAPGTAKAAGGGRYDLQDVERMLAVLDPWQDGYDWWVSTGMAINSEYPGADGLAVWERWADGKPGECAKKWQSFRKSGVTLGTLVYHARQNGWKPAGGDDVDDSSIPAAWRITSEDWQSCPLCAALYTEEFSDGTVRTFHRWCRQPSCQVYRKVKTRRALAPVFRWVGVRSEVVPGDDWRQWRENAGATVGKNWRGLPVGEDAYLAIYESPDGEDVDTLLEMAAAAILEKPKGRNVSTPRRRRNLADGPVPGPSPKERPQPVRPILVSRFAHRRRILTILDRLGIEWERQRLGGWKTAPLSDGQRIALRTALAFGVPGARSLNSALGTTAEFAQDAGWDEPYPRTVKEYRLACLRDRIPIQMTTWEAPKF